MAQRLTYGEGLNYIIRFLEEKKLHSAKEVLHVWNYDLRV